MLLVCAVAKGLIPEISRPPPLTPPHRGEGKRQALRIKKLAPYSITAARRMHTIVARAGSLERLRITCGRSQR